MRILSLNTYDQGGGAEQVALDLLRSFRSLGHDVRMWVRFQKTQTAGVSELDPIMWVGGGGADASRMGASGMGASRANVGRVGASRANAIRPYLAALAWLDRQIARRTGIRRRFRLRDWLQRCAWPRRWVDHLAGVEDYNYPQAWRLLDDPAWRPDLIHAHNLHGDYFDLRALPHLSQQAPFVWTLHDTWSFTGHCGYFIDCQRWREGCGTCPDLRRQPAIRRDRTAYNWARKQQIYDSSRLAVVTPSRWLMDQVTDSMLQPWRQRVIANGVNQQVFHTGDRGQARVLLGLDPAAFVCLYVTSTGKAHNPYKDYATVHRATERIAAMVQDAGSITLVCLGGQPSSTPDSRFKYPGRISDPKQMALYYQAADVLLHAAHADNFPTTVLEAQACGTPVVATNVGGISEQVADGETGFLAPRGDDAAMAAKALMLFQDPELCRRLGRQAAEHARTHFDLEAQAQRYLDWFQELITAYARDAAVIDG